MGLLDLVRRMFGAGSAPPADADADADAEAAARIAAGMRAVQTPLRERPLRDHSTGDGAASEATSGPVASEPRSQCRAVLPGQRIGWNRLEVLDLSDRLGLTESQLRAVNVEYRTFSVPKRSGGARTISAPAEPLKQLQRRILHRVLGRLRCHAAARGFTRGQSIVTNALPHARAAVLIRMDVKEFFPTTSAARVQDYFRAIGWTPEAAELLTRLCTHKGGLPQGAPTSPRLSNLVNFRLDARLGAIADKYGGAYTRYADDLTFSLPADDRHHIHMLIRVTKRAAAEEGYTLHQKRKLQIRRRHERQLVTGLVVNGKSGTDTTRMVGVSPSVLGPSVCPVRLPRATRRHLRAVRHHLAVGRPTTLTTRQLAGWAALENMVRAQGTGPIAP